MAAFGNAVEHQPGPEWLCRPEWRDLPEVTLRFGTGGGYPASAQTVWISEDFSYEGYDSQNHALSLFDALQLSDFPSKHVGGMPGALKTEAAPASWRLVWCHERCHKPASEGFRSDVSAAVTPAGGKLVCLRKAEQFGAWMKRKERPPFVLLTDWREAKPCVRAALQQPQEALPAAVVVLCGDARQKCRAREWSAGCPLPVYVQEDLGSPQAFVQDLLRLLARKLASAEDRRATGASRARARARLLPTPPPSPAPQAQAVQPEAFAWPLQMPAPVPPGQEAHWNHILKQAMPEAYED